MYIFQEFDKIHSTSHVCTFSSLAGNHALET